MMTEKEEETLDDFVIGTFPVLSVQTPTIATTQGNNAHGEDMGTLTAKKTRRPRRNQKATETVSHVQYLPVIVNRSENTSLLANDTVCFLCHTNIRTSELVYNMEYRRLRCGVHFGHTSCCQANDECRICYCLVCHYAVNLTDRVKCTCGCMGHLSCVQGGFLRSAIDKCARCDRFTHAPVVARKEEVGIWSRFFGEPLTSAFIRSHRGPAELGNIRAMRANGITAERIFQSSLTLGDLHAACVTLVDLRDLGFTGNMFVRRLFAPVILFSQFQTGPYYANDGSGTRHSSHVVTGIALLKIFCIDLVDIFCANVGIVRGPTAHQFGREPGTVPVGAETLALARFNFTECKEMGLTYEHVLFLQAPFSVWDTLLAIEEDHGYLRGLPCSPAFMGHRGYFLQTEIGWSDADITECNLFDEMTAPVSPSSLMVDSDSSDGNGSKHDNSEEEEISQAPPRKTFMVRPQKLEVSKVPPIDGITKGMSTMAILRAYPGA